MRTVFLIREPSTDEGTFGLLITDKFFRCYMLELPWRDNRNSRSCIPVGVYDVKVRVSPKYGRVFHIANVEGRRYILTHSGNWAGDVEKGYFSHSEGCLLFGGRRGVLRGQRAVLNSKSTMRAFEEHMEMAKFAEGEVAFKLAIMEAW